MNGPRRAASAHATQRRATGIRVTLSALGLALAASSAALGAVSLRVARTVVRPAGRVPDTRIVGVDAAAQTITLSRTPDTVLPGRYGLFTVGSVDYVRLGSIVGSDDETVTRKLLTHVPADSDLAAEAAFSGWYFDRPEQVHRPFRAIEIATGVGACPAWEFPAADDTDVWVIQVHGRGTTKAETLRAVPVFHDLGVTSLVVSYRNDGEAPKSPSGTYALGATEWRDVDAAIGYARRRGARRVILMGWSMGGALALQAALESPHGDVIAGLVLESPVVDWRTVLRFHGHLMRLPAPVIAVAQNALGSAWGAAVLGSGEAIPLDRLDAVSRAQELGHPILLLHSDDDGFVPSDASHALAAARPDLVTMETFEVARHTKLWNYDETRWVGAISEWMRARGLAAD
ncbi:MULTISPECIES: S9 family peptidase [Microbacterium]|uniref:alpha/beta hydrolase family protein n=1 Tax=Microbacterium TaxID=33882 RepID=UPI00277F0A80|nr:MULTISPECIES: alpha/beta fold hydrolase [Microbacterium]MDQ1084224.1 alpha-beta hydrolase superfamily lysophospholipase [Microbacterium sp. SORGH_AS_0344]MDQ1170499.1 alpha-beta hydrolase superfamily lysophospholipase [Microbacterium proteolyticum]